MPDITANDFANFWRAFDAAEGMPEQNRVRVYEDLYLTRGSRAFLGFVDTYLPDPAAFALRVRELDAFYRSIRFSTHRIYEFEGEIRHFYRRFRKLYPPVRIPNVYCLIGNLTQGTLAADAGILVGVEMFGHTDGVVTEALDVTDQSRLRPLADLPDAVIHEVVHVQQRSRPRVGDTLLSRAIREGIAVYVTEMVTGRRDPGAPHNHGDAHEGPLWEAFQEEMGDHDTDRWFGCASSDESRPANVGGYIGYQICRAFARRGKTVDRLAALIQAEDLEAIYAESGYGCE